MRLIETLGRGILQTQSLHWPKPNALRVQLCQRIGVACDYVGYRWECSKVSSLGGLEPPSSRLTAERASLLRHRDCKLLSFITFSCLAWYSPICKITFFIRKYIGAYVHGLATLVGLEPTAFEYLFRHA